MTEVNIPWWFHESSWPILADLLFKRQTLRASSSLPACWSWPLLQRPFLEPTLLPAQLHLWLRVKIGGLKSIDWENSVGPSAPIFMKELRHQPLKPGGQLVFEARVAGIPPPTIEWFKNGKALQNYRAQVEHDQQSGIVSLILPQVWSRLAFVPSRKHWRCSTTIWVSTCAEPRIFMEKPLHQHNFCQKNSMTGIISEILVFFFKNCFEMVYRWANSANPWSEARHVGTISRFSWWSNANCSRAETEQRCTQADGEAGMAFSGLFGVFRS